MNININFKQRTILLILLEVLNSLSSEIPRPRGVSLSRASLYTPAKDFVCLDGSVRIPFTEVNDDYCDCSDGSDEPGTSACPNGSFFCSNLDHKSINIPSSRVNDGICDCCDASDEYATKNNCVNNCNELGQAARLEHQRLSEIAKVGYQLKLKYSQKGLQVKQENKERVLKLQKHKAEAEAVQKEKETLKTVAEELETAALEKYRYLEEQDRLEREKEEAAKTRAEAIEIFHKFDSNQDGVVEISELQVRETFDKDRNGEVSVEEAKFFLNEQGSLDLERFVSEAWSLIKPFMLRDAGLFKPPSTESDKHQEVDEESNTAAESEGEATEDFGEYANEDEEEEEGDGTEPDQVEEAVQTETPEIKYDEETQKLMDAANRARKDFEAASQDVRDIQSELTNLENNLEKDYGPDEEFTILQGECFDYSDHEYIYKLCPFDKTIQQQKSSSTETRLGSWSKWGGTESNKYDIMIFEGGQQCWNGPQRSTIVRVTCGGENKLTAVAEPNRCEYEFDFITPAACKEIEIDTSDIHDEL